jgi:hypothetical protein
MTLRKDITKTLLPEVGTRFISGQDHRTLGILVSIPSLEVPQVNKDTTPTAIFLFFMEMIQLLVAQTKRYSNQWVPQALSPRVKQLRHEADHSHPSSAEVMSGGIPPVPQHIFMEWCLIKQ